MNQGKDGRPLLIIKTGAAIHEAAADGDFEDWIAAGMGLARLSPRVPTAAGDAPSPAEFSRLEVLNVRSRTPPRPSGRKLPWTRPLATLATKPGETGGLNSQPIRVCRVDQGEILPAPEGISGVVITGSPAMVTQRLDWSEETAEWLVRAVPTGIPILGICYGHQLLAHALGGRVASDPSGREIGTVRIRLEPVAAADPLFRNLPPVFDAQATHQESVVQLPLEAVELAASSHPANHAFRVGPCAWGVQFHPEFDDDVMRSYLQARAQPLRNEGLDPDSLLRGVRPAPVAAGILGRFSEIVAPNSTRTGWAGGRKM